MTMMRARHPATITGQLSPCEVNVVRLADRIHEVSGVEIEEWT